MIFKVPSFSPSPDLRLKCQAELTPNTKTTGLVLPGCAYLAHCRAHLGEGLPEEQRRQKHSLCPLLGGQGAPRWKLPGGRERLCEIRIFPNPQSRGERANTWPEWKQRVRDRK